MIGAAVGAGDFGSARLGARDGHVVLAVEYAGDVEVGGSALSADGSTEDIAVLRVTP